MDAAIETPSPPPIARETTVRRWTPRFGLRTLLGVVTLAAIAAAIGKWWWDSDGNRRDKEILQRMASLGEFEPQWVDNRVVGLRIRLRRGRGGRVGPSRLGFAIPLVPSRLAIGDLARLPGLEKLQSLVLAVDEIEPGALAPLANCGSLESLELTGELPDDAVAELASVRNVRSLTVTRSSRETLRRGLPAITASPGLRSLTLDGFGADTTVLRHAAPGTNVETLRLVGRNGARRVVFAPLANWPKLRELELLDLDLVEEDARVETLSRLRRVGVAFCRSESVALDRLLASNELESVRLWAAGAKAQHVEAVLAKPKLIEFDLLESALHGDALATLPAAVTLRRLTVGAEMVDEKFAERVALAKGLERVDLVDRAGAKVETIASRRTGNK